MTKTELIEAILNTMDNEMRKNYGSWLKRQKKETLKKILTDRTTNKEENI